MREITLKIALFFFTIGLLQNSPVKAQAPDSKNHVYLELAGKGLYYSVNYERYLFNITDELGVQASAGFGLFPGMTDIAPSKDITIPFELNFNYSFGVHNVAFGYGTTFWKYQLPFMDISNENLDNEPLVPMLTPVKEWFAHMTFDYRYRPSEAGLSFKAGITPLFFAKMQNFAYQKKSNAAFSANVGIGYVF